MSFHNSNNEFFSLSAGTFYTTPIIAVGAFVLVGIVVDSGDPMVAPPNITGPSGVTILYDAVPGDAPNIRMRIDWMYANATSLAWSIDDAAAYVACDVQYYDDPIATEFGVGGFIVEPVLSSGNDDAPTTASILVVCDPSSAAPRSVLLTADGNYDGAPNGPPFSWAYGGSPPHGVAVFCRNTVNASLGIYGPVVASTSGSAAWATAIWAAAFLTPLPLATRWAAGILW